MVRFPPVNGGGGGGGDQTQGRTDSGGVGHGGQPGFLHGHSWFVRLRPRASPAELST